MTKSSPVSATNKVRATIAHTPINGCPGATGSSWLLPRTQEAELQIHRQIKVAIDQEDKTGAGFDHCAWCVMQSIGLTQHTWRQFWNLLEADYDARTKPARPTGGTGK